MLQSEQNMNSSNNNLIYQDGLELRKLFCDRVNKVFGLNISVEEVKNNTDDMMGTLNNMVYKDEDVEFDGGDDANE